MTHNKLFFRIAAASVGVLMLFCSGCISLDEDLRGQPTSDKFFSRVSDFDSYVKGMYTSMNTMYGGDVPYIAGAAAEDVYVTNWVARWKPFEEANINAATNPDEVTGDLWKYYYTVIGICNSTLQIVNASDLSAQDLAPIVGEAKFMRALMYFNLTRFFREVPLITEENQALAATEKDATVEQIYAKIVSDLQDAEVSLPEDRSQSEKMRPTLWAAKAILSKVYLTMAGYPLNQTQYYALARDKANEVIQNGPFDLEDNFFDLWLYDNRLTNDEFIFAYYCNYDSGDRSYLARAIRPKEGGEGGWYDWCSSEQYLNEMRAYEQEYMTEEQKAAYTDGERVTGTFYLTCIDGTSYQLTEDGQPFVGKWRDGGPRNNGYWGAATVNNSDTFYPVIRFSEVLLIYAEAANMAEGVPSDAAYDAINRVRTRVGLPELPAGMSATDFDRQVLNERKFEFAFECHRWSDICRRQLLPEVMKAYYPEITVDEHNYWLPKPYSQLGIWTGTVQNAGY